MAWAARSAELTEWAWPRLVNRVDVWGAYTALDRRGKEYTAKDGEIKTVPKNWTAPATKDRGKIVLTREVLRRHFAATLPEQVIGTHTTSQKNTSLWGATEIDWHGDTSPDPEITWRAVHGWYCKLSSAGFHPLLTDSNSEGGYHLRTLFAEALPTARVFWFLKLLVRDYGKYGLNTAPEIFPKQSAIGEGKYGNWLRVPGRHHTNLHWSRVWGGNQWLDGNDAIDFILGLHGDSPSLVPEDCQWQIRVGDYMAQLPTGLGEGQQRDDHAYQFLAFMVRDLNLNDSYALEWAAKWDSKNLVPKGDKRLREILANVHQYGKKGYGSGLGGFSPNHDSNSEQQKQECTPPFQIRTLGQLLDTYPTLRPPVIDGLLRAGETMNAIAATKVRKSWLIAALAFAVGTGTPWLGKFATTQGDVLIIDNELHPETIAHRLRTIADAAGLPMETLRQRVHIVSLRGRLADLNQLGDALLAMTHRYALVIIDAFYRTVPIGTDENDNATIAGLYNQLDRYADVMGCAFALVHHASKGDQSNKSVTDVGSGAGSLSRAADTHLILRPHAENDCVVLDAAIRSWPPLAALCLRWEFPAWTLAPDLDPTDLRRPTQRRRAEDRPKEPRPRWTARRFANEFGTVEPQPRGVILEKALTAEVPIRQAEELLRNAVECSFLYKWVVNKAFVYSTQQKADKRFRSRKARA
jgi:hypothetical protein